MTEPEFASWQLDGWVHTLSRLAASSGYSRTVNETGRVPTGEAEGGGSSSCGIYSVA